MSGGNYRLYVDEVGTDDLTHVSEDDHRYLSLTGIAMQLRTARDELEPKFAWIKNEVFDHDPDHPLIFHRSDIVKKKRAFGVLNNPDKCDLFDRAIYKAMAGTEYCVITALVDKLGMINQPHWKNQHPYHYLMEIMVEKYVQLLQRKNGTGDVMFEGRKGKKDALLQAEFERVLNTGTYYITKERVCARVCSRNLKIRYKPDNSAGLQLADLIAHPSHMYLRSQKAHKVELGEYAKRVSELLVQEKYDRSAAGVITGYGTKWFP